MILAYIFILGVCIGSFLNVVIYRYNTGFTLNGRSKCFSCGRTLVWYDLIPIFSFVAFRGRCRTCKSRISWQYPFVELLTACLFASIYLLDGVSFFFILDCIIWSILVVITVYDLRHKIIPDGLVVAFILSSFVRLLLSFPLSQIFQTPHILDVLAGPLFFIPFFLLWFLSRGSWMGLGDGKLAIGMGALVGFTSGLSAVVLGFWVGALFSICLLAFQWVINNTRLGKHKIALYFKGNSLTMKSEIPFAPFLIIGLAIVFFFKLDVLMLGSFFY